LLAIVAFIFIFRKQLNCIPPINLEEEPPAPKLQEQIITTPSKPEEPSPAILQDTDIAPTEVTPAAIGTILVMDSSAANALPEPRIILVARSVVEIFLLVSIIVFPFG
jgi:hypothetical protein